VSIGWVSGGWGGISSNTNITGKVVEGEIHSRLSVQCAAHTPPPHSLENLEEEGGVGGVDVRTTTPPWKIVFRKRGGGAANLSSCC
jgi:hypothetical protein